MTEIKRREFLKAALAAMAATGVAGCKQQPRPLCYIPAPFPEERSVNRVELVKRLQQLGKSEPPKLLMGADCYSTFYPPVVKKPCPTCEQTMIVGEKDKILRQYNVPLKRIQDQSVNAILIIPKHCADCGFGLKEEKFRLEIKYPDYSSLVHVELDDAFDLELMALFLQGADRFDKGAWIGGGGMEEPLKDKVERLQELFGIGEEP